MKATATRTVEVKVAQAIAAKAVISMNAEIDNWEGCICVSDGPCSCSDRYFVATRTDNFLQVSPDFYGAFFGYESTEDKKVFTFYGRTCGGHTHKLKIDLCTGKLIASHIGARRSSGSIMFDHLPEEFWEINDSKDWELVTYSSSKPEWGVSIALLKGQFGEGPTNEEEADHMEWEPKDKAFMSQLNEKLLAVGRMTLGKDYFFDHGTLYGPDGFPTTIPKWTAIEYRRAGACGVRLQEVKK